jgi:O-antigen/teichoic acid export membrane protein
MPNIVRRALILVLLPLSRERIDGGYYRVFKVSKVRLRLSGAMAFASNVVGYLTGLIFTVFITRRLSERDFGVWALIGTFISYSITPFNLVTGWISRDAARGKKVLASAAALFILLTPISIIIYALVALGSATTINYDPSVMVFGLVVLIPYILLTLGTAIQSGYAPQNLGIAGIIFEISKVIIAFYLVLILRLGLIGALLTLSIAYLIQALFLLQKSTPLFQKEIRKELIAKWLKGAPINLISVLSGAIGATDIVLMGLMAGAVTAGYWQAALAASALVTSTQALMIGLGPRLISGGSQKDLDTALNFGMMVTIPAFLGFIALARDILWILRPAYTEAWIVACILALRSIIGILGGIGSTAITAKDEFDSNDNITIKDFIKSRIFLLNKIGLLLASLYIAAVACSLIIAQNMGMGTIEIITIIATLSLIFTIIGTLINMHLMKRLTSLKLTYRPLFKYTGSACIMATVVYFLRTLFKPPLNIIGVVGTVFLLTIMGALIYGLILYLISNEFRKYLTEIYLHIMRMKNSV